MGAFLLQYKYKGHVKHMKYFLKLRILKDNKKQAIHYFIPDEVAIARTVEEGYTVAANVSNEKHHFSASKNKVFFGKFGNDIEPGQVIEFADGEFILEFSLLSVKSGKRLVKKYLKSRKDTRVRDMEDFYLFVDKPKKIQKKRRSYGPLYPTSGMDPDLRAEYAKGEQDKKEKD